MYVCMHACIHNIMMDFYLLEIRCHTLTKKIKINNQKGDNSIANRQILNAEKT